ncbi:Cysteine sulfinate desulfinase/cysteine desulfurase and related enzymes-like protein [Sulfurimonas denitrificans DSM 1251]|uniref:Cysteine sulfinate desulfinase/cysteine desulfurase and related enzymes-like protein n=1 Tax=Sulfurimonas denitrificans (strain ATCC 33889 / DSM 1251) TaxID=326298 RepID=Q30SD6_SULDN|nr:cysteine desulfurase [Sulfurimonas denitrificans]ABB44095.1 Cysteine sulfinate desulfinase/cysteine desulfurase and related enzymes-like protein [Sulfurimonas denitrificans DSM 1251]
MINLNTLQYNKIEKVDISNSYSLGALSQSSDFETLCQTYKKKFGYKKLKTFSFSKEGFLGLLLELSGNICICEGESEALIECANIYEKLGFKIKWLNLNKDGKVNLSNLKDSSIDFLFLSSYVMDTFVKNDIQKIKELTNAKIISNGSAHVDLNSDALYFDNYKLTGFNLSSVLLFNDDMFTLLPIGTIDTIAVKLCKEALDEQRFNHKIKNIFLEKLMEIFEDNIYFFVQPQTTLDYSLHFGLKNIKARELIRTLALNKVFITNGEGCSLGLSKPSRIVQAMGYDEEISRNSIQLSFRDDVTIDKVDYVVNLLHVKYKQLISFNL